MNDLKYLFTAFYLDGTSFRQPADDQSKLDPAKSAFFDVDRLHLASFQITGAGRLAEVNLLTGQIWLDDKMVTSPTTESGFDLVYFRRHTLSLVVGGGLPAHEQSHGVEHHLGWSHPQLGTQTVVLL